MLEQRDLEKPIAVSTNPWEEAVNKAYDDLQNDPNINQAAKDALKISESKWLEFKDADNMFFDNVFARDPKNSAELYKDAILQDRAEQLQALKTGALTPADKSNQTDRKLNRCLGASQSPGDSVICLVGAANEWQIKKNQTLDSMVTTWSPEMRKELSKEEKAWQAFAAAEDQFLGLLYPVDGPADSGQKRLKAEINAVKDRALELQRIQSMASQESRFEETKTK